MKAILSLFLLVTLLCGLPDGWAGTIHPSSTDKQHLEYAQDFHSVYQVITRRAGEEEPSFGSCVIIDPHWALTAAHVVNDVERCSIRRGAKIHNIRVAIIHADWAPGMLSEGDIALLYIHEDAGLKFYPKLYEDDDEVNKLCAISGYGLTGTFKTGEIRHLDCEQRAGSNHVDVIVNDMLVCYIEHKKRTTLEFCVACGDSGGGLFIDNRLAGINSRVFGWEDKIPDSDFGDWTGHVRVSKYAKWIKEITGK